MVFRLSRLGFLFFLIGTTTGQTVIPDGAQISGTWTAADAPYIIQGQATVTQGSVLNIEAGVEVRFKTGNHDDLLDPQFDLGFLRIDGKLSARGEAGNPVLFTRDGSNGNWGLIYFSGTADSGSALSFFRLEYASQIQHLENWMNYSGAVSVNGSSLELRNCRLQNNAYDGLEGQNAALQISNTVVAASGGNGLLMLSGCSVQITNCTFTANGQDAVNSGYNSSLYIKNSIFWNNSRSLPDNLLATTEIAYSLLQENALPQGAQNLGGNLLGQNPRLSEDYALRSNSFCINSGSPDTTGLNLPPQDAGGNVRVAHGRIDMGAFEFTGNYLRVTAPNGLESWKIGTTRTIRWQSSVPSVSIEYSADDGRSWQTATASTQNDGAFDWPVPEVYSEQCRMRISDADSAALKDQSDSTFIISDVTVIPDGKEVSGLWRSEYAPYVVRGRAVVPKDSTLTIEPGVEVRFQTGAQHVYNAADFDMGMLNVAGQLLAQGQPEDSIRFTRSGDDGYWGIIFLNENTQPQSAISYVKIEYASYCDSLADSLRFSGALSVRGVNPQITHSTLTDNEQSGLQLSGKTSPEITENTISGNGRHGILLTSPGGVSQPLIKSDLIEHNIQDGIHIEGTFYAQIEQNRLRYNGAGGIYNYSGYATTTALNNFIEHNRTGIQSPGLIEITGNLIAYNERGVDLDHLSPQIMNNTFVRQSAEGIYCNESGPYVTNCIFNDNARDFTFVTGDASQPTLSYSLTDKPYLDGKVLNGGFVLLNRDAAFEGNGEHPFALKSGSPAIDRGTTDNQLVALPEKDLAGNPRIYDGNNDGVSQIDLGAYEFSALSADFTANVTVGLKPLSVQFTNQSVGEVDSLQWRFGDGDSSQAENPLHVYQKEGAYTVSLIVCGALGQSEKIRTDYIVVDNTPQVAQAIADTLFAEDSGDHLVALLSNVFYDADSADALSYQATSANPQVICRLSADSLWLSAAQNYFGSAQISVTATDPYGFSAGDTFAVHVLPVNDAPYISGLPDSLIFKSDSGATLSVWDYVSDVESPDSLLYYEFSFNTDFLQYDFTPASGLLKISALPAFSGSGRLRIRVQDDSGAVAIDSVGLKVEPLTGIAGGKHAVRDFRLFQNYPNPFNSATSIKYQLSRKGHVLLTVYNTLGQVVKALVDQKQEAGSYQVIFNAAGLASGVYLYSLQTDNGIVQTRKLLLLK